jgi:hypothetical protein
VQPSRQKFEIKSFLLSAASYCINKNIGQTESFAISSYRDKNRFKYLHTLYIDNQKVSFTDKRARVIVFNLFLTIFQLYISWWSVILVEETGYQEKFSDKKDLLCLMPLFSTIFQLYHGGQLYWWKKPGYQEKTTNLSHNVVSSTPHHEEVRIHNIFSDRH